MGFKEEMEEYFQKMELENPEFFDDDEDEEDFIPVVEVKEFYVSPGTGYDCDDCGYTPDTLRVTVYNDGVYDVSVMLGCTGGGGFRSTDVSEIREFVEQFVKFFGKEEEYKLLIQYLDTH